MTMDRVESEDTSPSGAAARPSHDSREPLETSGPRGAFRAQLLKRFSTWLDGTLAEESPPDGIAPRILAELEEAFDLSEAESLDDRCDMRALWSALTALVQEVKLQGRAFKELADRMAPLRDLFSRIEAVREAHAEALSEARRMAREALSAREGRHRDEVREAERRSRKELLEHLLDLRDRLGRGLEVSRSHLQGTRTRPPRTPLGRLLRGRRDALRAAVEAVGALQEGYGMALEHLDEKLRELGVSEIECTGGTFDPHTMCAAEVEETERVPEGTVLEVLRPGYLWGEMLLRAAQIKVARAPRGDGSTSRR